MRICRICIHCMSFCYILGVQWLYRNWQTRFVFSGTPEPPSLFPIICCMSISGTPDTRVTKFLGISSESTMVNNSESISESLSTSQLSWYWYSWVDLYLSRDGKTAEAISSWSIMFKDTARVFQAHPKITAEYFLAQEWSSGKPQIHSPVECHRLTFDTACILYSRANLDNAGTRYSPIIPLEACYWTVDTHFALPFNLWQPGHRVSSFRHWTFRCRRGSSRLVPA